MKPSHRNILIATLLIAVCAALRVVNAQEHFFNFAPVAAIALFSGAVIKDRRLALLMPLLASLAGDLALAALTDTQGFYGVSQAFVYAGFVLVALLGTRMGRTNVVKVAGFSIAGSLLFWVVSNFGVWAAGFFNESQRMYATDLTGLGQTFLMGLPFYTPMGSQFFFNPMIGDLLFNGLLFGAYAVLATKPRHEEVVMGVAR